MVLSMEFEYHDSSSSSSSSSPIQITKSPLAPAPAPAKHEKKAAGRKVFKETRHPVYRGVRLKNGGKWVCEVREPNKKSRIWLGTFPDPETAAVAHDVASLALRGDHAPLNFPDSAGLLPRARSSSHQDIRRAAFQAARDLNSSVRVSRENEDQEEKLSNALIGAKIDRREREGGEAGAVGFDDEEAVFNMPVLLDSMAEGMLLTPLAMTKGFSWSQYEEDEGLELNLWGE